MASSGRRKPGQHKTQPGRRRGKPADREGFCASRDRIRLRRQGPRPSVRTAIPQLIRGLPFRQDRGTDAAKPRGGGIFQPKRDLFAEQTILGLNQAFSKLDVRTIGHSSSCLSIRIGTMYGASMNSLKTTVTSMPSQRRISLSAGVLYLLTFVSIPTLSRISVCPESSARRANFVKPPSSARGAALYDRRRGEAGTSRIGGNRPKGAVGFSKPSS